MLHELEDKRQQKEEEGYRDRESTCEWEEKRGRNRYQHFCFFFCCFDDAMYVDRGGVDVVRVQGTNGDNFIHLPKVKHMKSDR